METGATSSSATGATGRRGLPRRTGASTSTAGSMLSATWATVVGASSSISAGIVVDRCRGVLAGRVGRARVVRLVGPEVVVVADA